MVASAGKLQVILLSRKPSAAALKETLALATDTDRLAFGGLELYWLPSAGIREAGLSLDAVTALVGTNTMRTKNTIEQMAAKFFG